MEGTRFATALPVDVGSRLESLFDLVAEVKRRVSRFPVLIDLVGDFEEMTKDFMLLFEASLMNGKTEGPREKWLRRHQVLDKLTREWYVIYSLASSTELGSSFLGQFQPYVAQATADIGVADPQDNFLLIPIFGENFSLVTVSYSASNVAILKLPISVIHSPWELSVIWHEMAGLKVSRIRKEIQDFLDDYAKRNKLTLTDHQPAPGIDPITELFTRIREERRLNKDLLLQVREFLAGQDGPGYPSDEIWSPDWFAQLFEDACSVLAFGDVFVPVLEKILGRQARKLTADRRYPDLDTRLQVARRLLVLQKGGRSRAVTPAERLTDKLLWAFIKKHESDPVAGLPVAFSNPEARPEIRQQLIDTMQDFNTRFGDLATGINETPLDLGAMASFGESSVRVKEGVSASAGRHEQVKEIVQRLFGNYDVDGLLEKPFSPSDELNFFEHGPGDSWQNMYINDSTHGPHTVYHYR
jgi:hypothetical protein